MRNFYVRKIKGDPVTPILNPSVGQNLVNYRYVGTNNFIDKRLVEELNLLQLETIGYKVIMDNR